MTDPSEWNKDIARHSCRRGRGRTHGCTLEDHRLRRDSAPKLNGNAPPLRQITTGTGVSTKELFALFPKGPAKKVAKISGLGKPEGCV